MVESDRLLSDCSVINRAPGSNPGLSAIFVPDFDLKVRQSQPAKGSVARTLQTSLLSNECHQG